MEEQCMGCEEKTKCIHLGAGCFCHRCLDHNYTAMLAFIVAVKEAAPETALSALVNEVSALPDNLGFHVPQESDHA